jgi:hypothetical protein
MNVGDDKGKILLQEMDKLPAPPKAVLVRTVLYVTLICHFGTATILLSVVAALADMPAGDGRAARATQGCAGAHCAVCYFV